MLLDQSEDILARILVTQGYLGHRWNSFLLPLVMTCKRLRFLVYDTTKYIDLSGVDRIQSYGITLNKIQSYLGNLMLVDLSYAAVNFNESNLFQCFRRYQETMRGISVRSTSASDEFLYNVVCSYKYLTALDISKINFGSGSLITDDGVKAVLTSCSSLEYLDLSSCYVTYSSIYILCR